MKITCLPRAARSTPTTFVEINVRGERSLRELELLGRRVGRREPMLELVAGLRERARKATLRIPRHPAKDLGRRAERAELRRRARGIAPALGDARRERIADRGGGEDRADQMRAAALVLLLAPLAVLVAADRDVLRAVVGGEVRAS